ALFFVISLVFPIYLKLFPPNQAYAVFGAFLVFTFWLYLLGIVFVLGAELNAFLEEPERSVATAEATSQAQQGKARMSQQPGQVQAEATGSAPSRGRRGPFGSQSAEPAADAASEPAGPSGKRDLARGGIGGTVIGALGMIVAALLI